MTVTSPFRIINSRRCCRAVRRASPTGPLLSTPMTQGRRLRLSSTREFPTSALQARMFGGAGRAAAGGQGAAGREVQGLHAEADRTVVGWPRRVRGQGRAGQGQGWYEQVAVPGLWA